MATPSGRTHGGRKPKMTKSSLNPKSTATYIGSTPHPPRRIRQHNGEITQGAWKTARNRPWVMNMIVHGFPSKLAALQFEWAWQHPNLSRHLRGGEMNKGRTLKGNIAVARSMLITHPYTTWPLHVKLFTPEATRGWAEACKNAPPLPPGFTFCVELEGVDGKRGDVGSGRKGPIDVTDSVFTSEHLAKHTSILATGEPQSCSICGDELDFQKTDPLSVTLCPTPSCTSYSHLRCLATSFLTQNAVLTRGSSLVPRGGTCNACQNYVLWGDMVRGCYRRRTGGPGTANEQSAIVEEAEQEGADYDELFGKYLEEPAKVSPRKPKARTTKRVTKVSSKVKKGLQVIPMEAGEFFDLDAISGSDSSSSHSSRQPISINTVKPVPRRRGRPPGSISKPKPVVAPAADISNEFFDIDDFSSTEEDVRLTSCCRKSKLISPFDAGLVDPMASMRIRQSSDVEIPVSPASRHAQKRNSKRNPGRGPGQTSNEIDSDVIEISD